MRFLKTLILFASALLSTGFEEGAHSKNAERSNAELVSFDRWAGPAIRVYWLRPETAKPDAPVVFVMHGVNRDADRYFDEWRPFAERYGFVLVVPEFSAKAFPKAAKYNLGGVIDDKGDAAARERWAYSAIEPLFDRVVQRFNLSADDYILYGHSAGAQFAHRFALFGAGVRARLVISANAGWYTFPDKGAWPYGPEGLPDGIYDQRKALGSSLVILAGEADTDPNHPSLRRTPEAMLQGATRFDRARAFYAAGAEIAAMRDIPFRWSCITAPGVNHSDAKAAPFAVALLFDAALPEGGPCRQGVAAE